MTVLVTGGAGYIGSHMVLALLDADETVVVIDNLSTGFDWLITPGAEFVRGDIGDIDLVGRTLADHDVKSVVHFAGSIVVPESITDPLGYYNNNTVKSRSLIETCVRAGVSHFIFSSTAAVYGMPEVSPVIETTPMAPISPYGTSKLMTEWMLRDTAVAHDMRYVALRYFNVAGADPKGRSGQSSKAATHLIKVASQAALGQRDKMQIFGRDYETRDGTCIRDYIHVSDLIAAHSEALAYLRDGGESNVFNCGYGNGYSVLEVIDTVKRISGNNFLVEDAPRRAGDPPSLIAGADKIRATLGWNPCYNDLDQIVQDAFTWEHHLIQRNAS